MNKIEELNQEQLEAVTDKSQHLLVLAGAGTGKTKTIVERAKYLLKNGVKPSEIVIVSFTRKSAREIAERIKADISIPDTQALVGQTFHSWCSEILAQINGENPQKNFIILDEDDRESAFKLVSAGVFTKGSISYKNVAEVYSYAVNAVIPLSEAIRIKYMDNAPKDEKTQNTIEKYKPIFSQVIKEYLTYKNSHHYWDYDDLLLIVANALQGNESLRNYYSSIYKYILIDEAQDTNPLQYKLLASFYENSHLFCVGDDAQSIYSFRGADFKTIHSFTKIVPNSNVKKLVRNYRSTQEILDLSNWLLSMSPLQYEKELVADKGHGNKPKLIHWNSEWEEANDITDRILKSIHDDNDKFGDSLVLSRGAYGLRKVEACCIEKKIPYIVFGGTNLMQSAHIRDVVSAMRIVADYHDELAWMRYLNLFPKIGQVTAKKIIDEVILAPTLDDCLSKLMELSIPPIISEVLIDLSSLQTQVVKAIEITVKGLEPVLKQIYNKDSSNYKWEARKEDFEILAMVAQGITSITQFINEYVLDPKLDEATKVSKVENDVVRLSTIHSAKGLEAKNCFIVNVSYFSFPNAKSIRLGEESIEEERRCLYVAMTRAKENLYIYRDISGNYVQDSTKENQNKLYFLNGLPKELVEMVFLSTQRERPVLTQEQKDTLFNTQTTFNFD